jgi:hypothetical protein
VDPPVVTDEGGGHHYPLTATAVARPDPAETA